MNRPQMVEKTLDEITRALRDPRDVPADELSRRILDAILPQVETVEELEALPIGTSLLRTDETGAGLYDWCTDGRSGKPRLWTGQYPIPASALADYLPLTVVWSPS